MTWFQRSNQQLTAAFIADFAEATFIPLHYLAINVNLLSITMPTEKPTDEGETQPAKSEPEEGEQYVECSAQMLPD